MSSEYLVVSSKIGEKKGKKNRNLLIEDPCQCIFHYALYSTPFLKLWLLLKRKNPIQ